MRADSDLIGTIANNVFVLGMQDSSWRALGFGHRPRRGFFWRLFTPAWKVALENRIDRELLLVYSASHLIPFERRDEILQALVELFYWGEDGERFARVYGFSTPESCRQTIQLYIDVWPGDCYPLLWERLGLAAVPDRKLAAQMMASAINFSQSAPFYIAMNVREGRVDMRSWRGKTRDEWVQQMGEQVVPGIFGRR